MPTLHGARVGLLESRLSTELAELVRRMGGTPVVAPSVREIPRPDETAAFVDELASGQFSVVIFQTGVGTAALLRDAETTRAAGGRPGRGWCGDDRLPRPQADRRRATARTGADDRPAEAVHHRRRCSRRSSRSIWPGSGRRWCTTENATPRSPTRSVHAGPNWPRPVRTNGRSPKISSRYARVVRERERHVDALVFTSQVQVRHLFNVAEQLGMRDELTASLNDEIIVAAVGPVCADALKEVGVTPDVQPADPKMGPLLIALGDYIELTRDEGRGLGAGD